MTENWCSLKQVSLDTDPNGIPAHDPGAKLDGNKPHTELLLDFANALNAVAEVATYGAKKYSRGGWQHVGTDPFGFTAKDRYTGALLRHLLGERESAVDGETGILHAAHLAWNALARLELMLRDHTTLYYQQTHDKVSNEIETQIFGFDADKLNLNDFKSGEPWKVIRLNKKKFGEHIRDAENFSGINVDNIGGS